MSNKIVSLLVDWLYEVPQNQRVFYFIGAFVFLLFIQVGAVWYIYSSASGCITQMKQIDHQIPAMESTIIEYKHVARRYFMLTQFLEKQKGFNLKAFVETMVRAGNYTVEGNWNDSEKIEMGEDRQVEQEIVRFTVKNLPLLAALKLVDDLEKNEALEVIEVSLKKETNGLSVGLALATKIAKKTEE